jgi:hypothetical protein
MIRKILVAVDNIIIEWIAGISELKTDIFSGIYLTGSIPLNDFHSGKSDIDFVVLCKELPKGETLLRLKQVHRKIEKKFKESGLSGCYITHEDLNIQHSQSAITLCFNQGRMKESVFDMAAVTLYEIKTTAITLSGIPAQALPVTISINDVNRFHFKNINTYWKSWVAEQPSFNSHRLMLILFPRLTEWIVLGVARQLYTLRTGTITSKTNAGYYCLEHLPYLYQPIIKEAIKIRKDMRKRLLNVKNAYYVQPSFKRARATVACANYIIQLFNKEYNL